MAKSAFPKLIGGLCRPTAKEYDCKVRTVMGRMFALALFGAFVVIGIGIMGLRMLPVLLNVYLSTYTDAPLTAWGYGLLEHTLAAMGGGIFVILFGFLLVTAILSSSLLAVGWLVDFVLVVASWGAGRFGRDLEVKERIRRLRSVIKGIVTRPGD